MVYGTYNRTNTTTQEYALSSTMRAAWSRFAKNPMGGPGWNPVGTGVQSAVLVGAEQLAHGGSYVGTNDHVEKGAWDLGLFGNRFDVQSSGVSVIDQWEVDYRCGLFLPLYLSVLNPAT